MAPVTMNPFIAILLQQLISYITEHAEEIIAAIVKFLSGKMTPEIQGSIDKFRATPNAKTFDTMVTKATQAGKVNPQQLAATIITQAKIKV